MARRAKSRPERERKRIPVRPAVDGSELCLQCGLCCDGTLFTNVKMNDDERDFVESLGLDVEVHQDGSLGGFRVPCPHLVEGACSLYAARRPATCGTYRCELLVDYASGTKQLEEVLPVVHLVRALARELEVEMGVPAGSYTRRALQEYITRMLPAMLEPRRAAVAPEHVRFVVAFTRLNLLGLKYFRYQPIPIEVETAAAGESLATN